MSGDGQTQEQRTTRVLVLGETPIARGVVAVGAALGYEVAAFDATALDGVAGVVLASHGGPDEDAALRASLHAGVPYIGLVAGRARGQAVVATLDVDAASVARIHTPAGLDIGPATPEEIALAILAEMVSVRPRVPGQARAARGKRTCSH
ncbi:MAG TPA: XdhC family protein [Acidimicrobiia bacterium]|nr:XdhC family protein [Acidimicrobiia bacterium]